MKHSGEDIIKQIGGENVVQKKHYYKDLPSKGLGRSFDDVGLDEPVIIPFAFETYDVIWESSIENMKQRASELDAEVLLQMLLSTGAGDYDKYKVWFKKKTGMSITEKIDQFIAENGGNTRDALNVALARLEAAEAKILEEVDSGLEDYRSRIRKSFAKYWTSEGCECCQDTPTHKEAEKELAELLDVDMYSDESGFDWGKYQ